MSCPCLNLTLQDDFSVSKLRTSLDFSQNNLPALSKRIHHYQSWLCSWIFSGLTSKLHEMLFFFQIHSQTQTIPGSDSQSFQVKQWHCEIILHSTHAFKQIATCWSKCHFNSLYVIFRNFQLRYSCRFPYISAVSAGCSADADAGDAEALAWALAEALAGEPVPPSMATHRRCGRRATERLLMRRKKDCRKTPRLRWWHSWYLDIRRTLEKTSKDISLTCLRYRHYIDAVDTSSISSAANLVRDTPRNTQDTKTSKHWQWSGLTHSLQEYVGCCWITFLHAWCIVCFLDISSKNWQQV